MIDIEKIRQNAKAVIKAVARKGYKLDAEAILSLDETRRELIQEIEVLRKEANEIADKGKDTSTQDRERGRHLKEQVRVKEDELEGVEKQLNERLLEIPNLPFDDVPDGKDESDNKVIRSWGKPPKFSFKPKNHLELSEALDIVDFKAGAKVSGSQFYFLKNEGVLLELALTRYALDVLIEDGFIPMTTPDLARERFYLGTGYNPKGEEAQIYEIEGEDLGLIATAEVALAGYHADEIIEEKNLPLKYAGYSHCFRKEAGAYGKYSKGLYRVHHFTKVEMFTLVHPDNSASMLEDLLAIEEKIYQGLEIPYQVVEMSAGDLGAQAAKKYDLDAWMPGRDDWGEVTSASNTTDYQSRRLNIKFRDSEGTHFVHTLNGTAIASSRVPIAILENFQNKDGSVDIPKALHKYLPFTKISR